MRTPKCLARVQQSLTDPGQRLAGTEGPECCHCRGSFWAPYPTLMWKSGSVQQLHSWCPGTLHTTPESFQSTHLWPAPNLDDVTGHQGSLVCLYSMIHGTPPSSSSAYLPPHTTLCWPCLAPENPAVGTESARLQRCT